LFGQASVGALQLFGKYEAGNLAALDLHSLRAAAHFQRIYEANRFKMPQRSDSSFIFRVPAMIVPLASRVSGL
jgi:hypothetical protein